MDDEPLEEWAARREARRQQPGERQAVPLDGDPQRGEHVEPAGPRVTLEWDGQQWVPYGVAENRDAALQETGPQDKAARVPLPAFGALPPAPEPFRPTQVFRRPPTPPER